MDKKEDEGKEEKSNEPPGRRGACSFIHNDRFYLYSGYSGGPALVQRSEAELRVLDLHSGLWSAEKTSSEGLPECISGACCTVVDDCLYVFGGWLAGFRNAAVHELKLSTLTWRELPEKNPESGPILKDKAGMVAYGKHMLCVFGGYGYPTWEQGGGQRDAAYHPDEESSGHIYWTNELHLFNIPTSEWISPVTSGVRPPPCAAFSFTKVDRSRVVLFGGRQQRERVNEVHILDMSSWHWSGVIMPSRPDEPWPVKRSFHTACSLVDPDLVCSKHIPTVTCGGCQSTPPQSTFEWLPFPIPDLSHPDEEVEGKRLYCDPKLLVTMGMDNNADPVIDAWVLNVNLLTWEKVILSDKIPGRIWHTMASHHPSSANAEVVMFGGTSQNLFSTHEQLLANVSQTTILLHGVSSLYEIACSVIASDWSYYLPFLTQLPLHVQEVIGAEKDKLQRLYDHFTVIKL